MEKGSIISGSFFLLRYLIQDTPQVAFVVPKKVAKSAVKRNSLRRKGYNIIYKYNINKNIAIFFYKKEGLNADSIYLKKDIDLLLKKSKII